MEYHVAVTFDMAKTGITTCAQIHLTQSSFVRTKLTGNRRVWVSDIRRQNERKRQKIKHLYVNRAVLRMHAQLSEHLKCQIMKRGEKKPAKKIDEEKLEEKK